MEEILFALGLLLLLAIILSPVITLVICKKISRKQDEIQISLQTLLQSSSINPTAAPQTPPKAESGLKYLTVEEMQPRPVPPPPAWKPETPSEQPAPSLPRPVAPQPVTGFQVKVDPETYAPGRFEALTQQILRRIWNWIIVGEEFRNPDVSVEYAVATNWLVRIGVLIMVVGVGFFLEYTSSRGWLGPMGKVSIGLIIGAALVATGIRLLGKRYHLLGQGLLGAGVAIWYGAIFTAFNRYSLIGPGGAFTLMALVTIGAGIMSVRFNSVLVAILGIIGGYGTPIMLSTDTVNFFALYSYMLLLGIGVLGIARYRSWHLLNALAFAATWLLAGSALESGFSAHRYWEVVPFLTAFFILFSTVIFIYQVVHGVKATLLELLMLLLNAAVYFGIMYHLTETTYDRIWTAIPALGLAAFYMAHLVIFLRRQNQDRALALSFTALAAFFLIITLPILISGAWLTLCWSVQALILLWMAVRLRSRFLHWIAYLLYGIVTLRFLFLDLHSAFGPPLQAETTAAQYLLILLERITTFGVPAATFALAMRILNKAPATTPSLAITPENDVPETPLESNIPTIFGTLLFGLVFVYLHLELAHSMLFAWEPLRLPLLTVLWTGACLVLLRLFMVSRHPALHLALLAFCAITLIKLFAVDLPGWEASAAIFRYATGYSFLDAGLRLIDYGVILAFLAYGFFLLKRQPATALTARLFGYGAVGLLWIYTTFEINTFFAHYVPTFRAGAVSVYWALYALSMITGGITRSVRPLRLAGLALLAFVCLKIFISDLAHLDAIYRIVAFVLLGGVLLAGAYVYLRFQDRFINKPDQPEETHDA